MLYGLALLLGLFGERLHAFYPDVGLIVVICLGALFPFCIICPVHTYFLMRRQMLLY